MFNMKVCFKFPQQEATVRQLAASNNVFRHLLGFVHTVRVKKTDILVETPVVPEERLT